MGLELRIELARLPTLKNVLASSCLRLTLCSSNLLLRLRLQISSR